MKFRMVKLYKTQVQKDFVTFLLKLQLIVEEIVLPSMRAQLEWNEKLFDLSEKEFLRAKAQVKKEREQAAAEFGGLEYHGIKDATAVINAEAHQLRQ